MGLKSSQWSCLKACFKGYTFCFTFLVRPSTRAQQSHEQAQKKRLNDLERSRFCQQVQSFVCVPPWRRVTVKFWEMLKNASEVTLVPKKHFFPRNFELRAKCRGVLSKPRWRYVSFSLQDLFFQATSCDVVFGSAGATLRAQVILGQVK